MNLDVHALGTFNRLAHSGAETAAWSLSELTGIETHVNVTNVELGTASDVEREFGEHDFVSIRIGFSGGLDGRTILAFDRDSAMNVVEAILPGATAGDELATSGLKEVGNIMLGGFIDGWANHLETTIDITTPTYLDVDSDGPLDDFSIGEDGYGGESDHIIVFRNQLETVSDPVLFYLYMVPTAESVGTIADTATNTEEALPIESFTAFSEMIDDGAEQASADISAMTGTETVVDVSRLSFVPIEGVPMQLDDTTRVGVVLEFEGTPSGYIAILFDEPSSERIATALLPGADAGEAMRQSALQEIGNIITSGFLDGWANRLETTIEISPPQFVHDLGPAIIDPLATELAQNQDYAFLIDSTIRTDDDEFSCDIYALPNETELHDALDQLTAQPAGWRSTRGAHRPAERPIESRSASRTSLSATPRAHSRRAGSALVWESRCTTDVRALWASHTRCYPTVRERRTRRSTSTPPSTRSSRRWCMRGRRVVDSTRNSPVEVRCSSSTRRSKASAIETSRPHGLRSRR
jgi:chemotaxis protein CheC